MEEETSPYLNVKVNKLYDDAVVPTIAHFGDAGRDLTAYTIERKRRVITIGTGISMEIPLGYVGLLFARSSLHKKSVWLANSVGVIDSGYRGEIMLKLFTLDETTEVDINKGDRVGQIIILPFPYVNFVEGDLSSSERQDGGFGSSGR